jgi:ACS family sodium-dependent inorganic phosphate cotransporter-like MFS transporter 5
MIPGGWLTVRFGGKKVLCLVILTSSIFTLLTPLAARISYLAMIICRFLTGFFQVKYST